VGDNMNKSVINAPIDFQKAIPAADILPLGVLNDAVRKKVDAAAESLLTLEYDGDKIEPTTEGL